MESYFVWCPAYFMVDFAQEEKQALENVLSGKPLPHTNSFCPWLNSFLSLLLMHITFSMVTTCYPSCRIPVSPLPPTRHVYFYN